MITKEKIVVVVLALSLTLAASAHAQYSAIPNITGPNAGQQFRTDINERFGGLAPISPLLVSSSFANLPPEQDGLIRFCADCQKTTPCAGGGSGALARGTRGAWSCSGGTLEQDLDAGGHAISNASVNNQQNAVAYGAVCSDDTLSCTLTSGNATISCASAPADFQVGQHIHIGHAGASSTLATPTLTSVTAYAYALNPRPTPNVLEEYDNGGNPGTCQTDTLTGVSGHNASCAATYGYALKCVAQSGLGAGSSGMYSADSATVYVNNAAATLSPDNHNTLKWTSDPNCVAYVIKRCAGASCAPAPFAVYPNLPVGQAAQSLMWSDFGSNYNAIDEDGAFNSSAPAAANLDATITAINGTSITLAVAPSQSGSFTMYHDDTPAAQAAINASYTLSGGINKTTSGPILLPGCRGGSHYHFADALSFFGDSFGGIDGHQAPIIWDGPVGGIFINGNWGNRQSVSGIDYEGTTGNTMGIMFDLDDYGSNTTQGPGHSNATTGVVASAWTIGGDGAGARINCNGAMLCVDFGGLTNVENNVVNNLHDEGSQYTGKNGWAAFYSNSQQTDNETIENGVVTTNDFGFFFRVIGDFQALNEQVGNRVDYYLNNIQRNALIQGGHAEAPAGTPEMVLYDDSNAGSLMVVSDAWNVDPGPAGYAVSIAGGQVVELNGVTEDTRSNATNLGFHYGHPTDSPVSIVNSYLNPLRNPNSGGAYPVTPGNLPFTDVNGGQALPNVIAMDNRAWGEDPVMLWNTQATTLASLEASSIQNDCAGTATLSGGAATVTNSCITTGRPIICTDNTGTTAAAASCIPSAGSLAIHGTGSDAVSWAQF